MGLGWDTYLCVLSAAGARQPVCPPDLTLEPAADAGLRPAKQPPWIRQREAGPTGVVALPPMCDGLPAVSEVKGFCCGRLFANDSQRAVAAFEGAVRLVPFDCRSVALSPSDCESGPDKGAAATHLDSRGDTDASFRCGSRLGRTALTSRQRLVALTTAEIYALDGANSYVNVTLAGVCVSLAVDLPRRARASPAGPRFAATSPPGVMQRGVSENPAAAS
jgi:hypothetical protein